MDKLIVTPKSPSELKFLNDLLEKLDIKSVPLSESEMEDLGLSLLMKNVDRSKKVGKEKILKKLRS